MMQSVSNKREQQSQMRRERILLAAREIFPLHGYHRSSIAKIARQAGVSAGLIYRFFDSKQGLYEAVLEQELRSWLEQTSTQAACLGDPLQEMENMFTEVFDIVRKNPILEFFISGSRGDLEQYLPIFRRAYKLWRKRFIDLLEIGIGSGEFRRDLDVQRTADVIHSLLLTYLDRAFNNHTWGYPKRKLELGRDLDEKLVASVGDFIRNAIKI